MQPNNMEPSRELAERVKLSAKTLLECAEPEKVMASAWQGVIRGLLAELAATEMPVVYRHLPWLKGKGVLFAIYGSSSIHYADELEKKLAETDAANTILELNLDECKALMKFLEKEYIAEDAFPGARDVVRKMTEFIKAHDELDRGTTQSTL